MQEYPATPRILYNSIKDSGEEKKGVGNGIIKLGAKEMNGGRINSGETRAADIGRKPVHLALYNVLHSLMRATRHGRENVNLGQPCRD